jgi:hypothetical protein
MSSEHFTVTVGEREYDVVLNAKGQAISVTTRVERCGSWGVRRLYPIDYRTIPGPTVCAVIQAAQAMQQQPNQERRL